MKVTPLQSYPDFLPTTNKRYLLGSYRVKSFDEETREYVLELDEHYSPKELRIPEKMQLVSIQRETQFDLQNRLMAAQMNQASAVAKLALNRQDASWQALAHQNAQISQAQQQAIGAQQRVPENPESIRTEIERLQKQLKERMEPALYDSLKNPDHLVSISRTYDGTKFFYETQS